jgi:3-oxoacyl-[acyl-carrier protein] reductase
MARALEGRRAIVTGAASGLGRAIALRFARAGAPLALCDRDGDALEEVAAIVRAEGGSAFTRVFDLVDGGAIATFVADAAQAMGGIDIVCNNAALAIRTPVDLQDEEGWDFIQDVNLKATFFMVKHALPHLRTSGRGSVVNISSMAGSFGIAGLAAYCASKGGVNALSRALAVELAPDNIRVNVVAPGSMMTPAVQRSIDRINQLDPGRGEQAIAQLTARQIFRRAADPDEVAAIAQFLASDEASFLTGEIINASAGWAAN